MNAFRLYAMPTKPETIDGMGGQRFSRVTPEYSLVYTDGDAPKGSVELSEDDAGRLSKGDEIWLRGCNTQLIAEEIERQRPEIFRRFSEHLDKLGDILREIEAESKEETAADESD